MARWPSPGRTSIARINGRTVTVEPRETLLQAALRQGIAFPHGCRVGGCATCRCRLVEGRVKELTETAYLLSDEELDRGFILACQSVPTTDVGVEVDLAGPARPARPEGPPAGLERAGPDQAGQRELPEAAAGPDVEAPGTGAPGRRVEAKPAGAIHDLKYFLFHAVGLLSAAVLLAGGHLVTLGLLAVLAFYLVGDALCGDDTTTPRFGHPALLTAQLWLALPLLLLIVFAALWGVSPGDPLGFGAWVGRLTGHDLLAARDGAAPGHLVSAWVLTGLMIGMVGTIPAHELTHRTWDPISMWIGRWLLAFSFDTAFAIEHVYGHHRYVSTEEDPATAPRGRSVYAHVVVSTVRGNLSAWRIERRRLQRRGLWLLGWHNTVLRGHAMSLLLVVAAAALGGWRAAGFLVASGAWGKALLEIVNYMEHYGMVRDPRMPVRPRHSWNTNRRISSWTMFNLTRHSHHHAQGEVPYQDLKPLPRAPLMINGYLTTIVVAMIPPLWHRLMTPRLLAWDEEHASAGERRLAAAANARSGLPALLARGDPTSP